MSNDVPIVKIDLTPEYKRNLRSLAKRFRNIRVDTQVIIEQIQSGNFLGDRIAGLGENYLVLKVRVKNNDIQKGKSAGYRIIYQVESATSVLLLTIYSKSDREDIEVQEIINILTEVNTSE
ncbi:MAG TPA: type II toxin-antitoxin system RelE/ParE family toxin [Nostocaceae cyanobacterium]|nr:type II toxin-antitoxin system RelE/ParE family toxin [Nostocaceae cyanobacterium]